ncbi:MAG: hypothetical protein JNK02_04015 [Planctomycetes bacterium]|nr:hypothetical protein [Planctomycetota bacterium]
MNLTEDKVGLGSVRALWFRFWRRMFWASMRGSARRGDDFVTFHSRPKRARDTGTWPDPGTGDAETAVVMQGPIAELEDFTLETLRLYRRHFPRTHLILSTWDDTPETLLAPIRALGVDVLLGPKPAVPGLYNINLQVVSAARGIEHAGRRGARWVLKTRTDQRMYSPQALRFLVATALAFPVTGGFRQRHRIVGVGHGTLKYAPYHLTDQTVFGHVDDMTVYWNPPPHDGRLPAHWPPTTGEIFAQVPIGEQCRHGASETYLASQFLARVGRELTWTLEDSWEAFRDNFCVVDRETSVDFYWVKVQSHTFLESLTRYGPISNRRELTFGEWLPIYTGRTPCASARAFEQTLRGTWESAVPEA